MSSLELSKRKLKILMVYPFFMDFLEQENPDVKKFLENLRSFFPQLEGFDKNDLRLLESISMPLSRLPKEKRYDRLLLSMLHIEYEGYSFSVKDKTFHIEPLSNATLKDAINLVNRIFPEQGIERADIAFRGSLAMEKKGVKSLIYKSLFRIYGVSEVHYWVVIYENTQKVVGVTGLYCHTKDQNEADWGGWMCVDTDFRKYGIAFKIGEFTITKARARGKKYLRLYTSTGATEATVNLWYDRKGFKIIRRKPIKGGLEKLYREKEL